MWFCISGGCTNLSKLDVNPHIQTKKESEMFVSPWGFKVKFIVPVYDYK
jgi:hypothetical protein